MKLNKIIKSKEFLMKLVVTLTIFMVMVLSFFFTDKLESLINTPKPHKVNMLTKEELKGSSFEVCYLDVGQGNSCLVKLPDDKTILIDGGNVPYAEKVVNFIKDEGINTIDYMIATHADSDHIGGLASVLDEFQVKNIFRPFQIAGTGTTNDDFVVYEDEDLADVYKLMQNKYKNESKISRVTSLIYKEFITKIYNETYTENETMQNASVTVFYDGLTISGDNYSIEFYAPLLRNDDINLKDYSRTNGYATCGYGTLESNGNSAIFLLKIFNEKFLFTGDAPYTSGDKNYKGTFEENDFIKSLTEDDKSKLSNISVYLVGHHGSKYSSSLELLGLIDACYGVISVDDENDYGHPSSALIDRLYDNNISGDYLLMTSESGNITFGKVNGVLVYVLENVSNENDKAISWYTLSIIIFIFLVYFTFSIRLYNDYNHKIFYKE